MTSINNQLREVLESGCSVFFRNARSVLRLQSKAFSYSINAFWAIPVLIFMRVIRLLVLIRIGVFNYGRVGHFAADVGQRKAESLVNKSPKRFDFWYLPDNHLCSNAYWAKIARRWFKVHPMVRYLCFWNRIVPFGDAHRIGSSGTHHSRDVEGTLEKAKLSLPITPDEEVAARSWMAQFGWTEGQPFVCLLVRDSSYLTKLYPEIDTSYHDYRDSDIQTYINAIGYLTSQGVFVFRMGKEMMSRVKYNHDKFVDYAFCASKSDFLDVWLFSNCNLCISTGSGPDMISDVFRRPILALNFIPLHGMWSWSNALHYPKILRWKNSGEILSLADYLDQTHYTSSDFIAAGINIIDLDEYQILEAVKEAWQRVLGEWRPTEEESVLQERFKLILKLHEHFHEYHKFLHPESKLAFHFLSDVAKPCFR